MLDASRDGGLVAAWWDERPQANIGLNCGKSGLLVVDLDGEEAVAAWAGLAARHRGRERTLVARTRRGYHLFFSGAGPSSAGRVGAGIDTRGAGGYVILAPSIHQRGSVYRWLDPTIGPAAAPAWLLERLDTRRPASPVGEERALPDGVRFTSYGLAAVRALAREMAATPEGERNRTLNALAYRCGRLSAAGQLAREAAERELAAAALQAGLDEDEVEATFSSGFEAGLLRPISLEQRR
jgi:hypothetical protein